MVVNDVNIVLLNELSTCDVYYYRKLTLTRTPNPTRSTSIVSVVFDKFSVFSVIINTGDVQAAAECCELRSSTRVMATYATSCDVTDLSVSLSQCHSVTVSTAVSRQYSVSNVSTRR